MKINLSFCLFFFTTVLLTSCTKDDVNDPRALEGGIVVQVEDTTILVTTSSISTITDSTAVGGGSVVSNGGKAILARGVCWSISTDPTLANAHTTNGTGEGSFISQMTGLNWSTMYYVRAYAIDSTDTIYGNQISFITTSALSIGDSYAGGIIFYLDSTGAHGIVCAASDQSASADWGCPGVAITGADAASVGSGNLNTTEILTSCPTATAAKICDTLSLNGYSDWFLPSKDELQSMYTNLHAAGLGSFFGLAYWSSTEMTNAFAWQIIFSSGTIQGSTKNNFISVRAVRAF